MRAIKFFQPSESTPSKTIIGHASKMESFICSLNPAAILIFIGFLFIFVISLIWVIILFMIKNEDRGT